jgi:hypothetical protein
VSTLVPDINTTDGTAGEMFDILLRNADNEESRKRRKQQHEAGQQIVQQVEQVKKLTAGVHFNSKEVRIGVTALQRVRAQHEKREMEQLKKDGKKADEQRERRKKAMEVRALNRPESQWTRAHLKAMCMYKKLPSDKGLPESQPLLQQCWNERRNRLSPPGSPAGMIPLVNFHAIAEQGSPPHAELPTVILVNSPAEDISTLTDFSIIHGIQHVSM